MEREPAASLKLDKLKEERPELFRPIPQRVGVTMNNPGGYPTGTVEDWRGKDDPSNRIEIQECGEKLVNIANLSPPIFTSNDYGSKLLNSGYDKPLHGSTIAQYARESVAEKLQAAQKMLPENLRIFMFDAWRSLEAQYATYEMCYESLVERLTEMGVLEPGVALSEKVQDLISRETQNYISLPSPLPADMQPTEEEGAAGRLIPSPHNTGGSVDVGMVAIDDEYVEELQELEKVLAEHTDPFSLERAKINFYIAKIYREHSTSLEFGTEFDFAGSESNLLHFEDTKNEARDNRRLMYNVMTAAGFQPYSEEWWHFNYGNQMAKMTEWRTTGERTPAIYGGIEIDEEQRRHEQVHAHIMELLSECALNGDGSVAIPKELVELGVTKADIVELSELIGDPRNVRSLPRTHDMKYRGEIPAHLIESIKMLQ